jgi:FkbM family methyltransferase
MPNTFEMLARSVQANGFEGRCVLYNEGLGAAAATGSFHLSTHATNPGSSHISTDPAGQRIRIRPIDSIEVERPIRFIKIDVEGFEPNVIRGAIGTIDRYRPVILTEFFPRSLREIGGMSGADYLGMLEKLGYEMRIFPGDGGGDTLKPGDAHRFDDIPAPLNLVCLPSNA